MTDKPDLFDATRYPTLLRVCETSSRGRMELVEVSETSDGFLVGQALIGEGEDAFYHSVFLGAADDYR